jgi:WD40 repeat protein
MNVTPRVLDHGGMYIKLAFSPDGSLLAGASRGSWHGEGGAGGPIEDVYTHGRMLLWRTNDWSAQTQWTDNYFNDITWHPAGQIIATSNHKRVTLWEASTGRPLWWFVELQSPEGDGYEGLSFSPDGELLAIGSEIDFEDADVLLVNGKTGENVHTLMTREDDDPIPWVTFLPDGEHIIGLNYSYDYVDTAHLWSARSGKRLTTFHYRQNLDDYEPRLFISPTGRYLSTNGDNQLWELELQPKPRWRQRYIFHGHAQGTWNAEFSPDEQTLATMGSETYDSDNDIITFSVRLWDLASRRELAMCSPPGKCYCFGISPDSRLLATMSGETKNYFSDDASEYILTLWDIPSGRQLMSLTTTSQTTNLLYHHPDNMCFSPDGRWLAVSHLKHVEVWDMEQIGAG